MSDQGWIIFGLYVVGFVCTWRRFVMMLLENIESKIDTEIRALCVVIGTMFTLMWPAAIFIRFFYLHLMKHDFLLTSKEKAEKLQRENDHLRHIAKEAGLPFVEMPDE